MTVKYRNSKGELLAIDAMPTRYLTNALGVLERTAAQTRAVEIEAMRTELKRRESAGIPLQ